MKRICRGLLTCVLLLFACAQLNAQPAEVSVRIGGPLSPLPPCEPGSDSVIIGDFIYDITIGAKSVLLQDGATLGFVIYSPDGSMDASDVFSARMLGEWATNQYWNLPNGLLTLDTVGTLPESFLTGGAALSGAGFQESEFVDIAEVSVYLVNSEGTICIDSAFYPPSGAWWMSPDGAPVWHGGDGDVQHGGSRPDAKCYDVRYDVWTYGPCSPHNWCTPQFLSGLSCDTFEFYTYCGVNSTNFEFTTDGEGTALIDSSLKAVYIPSDLDTGSIVSGLIQFDTPDINYCGDSITSRCSFPIEMFVRSCYCCDTPGDGDHNGSVSIADVTFNIARIFSGGPRSHCPFEGDADASGSLTIADVTYLIQHIFSGGPDPICGSAG